MSEVLIYTKDYIFGWYRVKIVSNKKNRSKFRIKLWSQGSVSLRRFPRYTFPFKMFRLIISNRVKISVSFKLRTGDFWRGVSFASVSDCIPSSVAFEFIDTAAMQRPTYLQAAIDDNYLVEKPKFPCPRCPSVFSHKNNLYYHMKFECGQSPRFKCPYCTYRTKHVSNARAHVRRKHPGNKVYTIDVGS